MRPLAFSLLTLLVMLGDAGAAHAASFDCTVAHTAQEHAICKDKALGVLDDRLNQRFRETMGRAASQDDLMRSQRTWLRERDKCIDNACLKQAYVARLAALDQVPSAGYKRFADPEVGISFDYLANRQIEKSCKGEPRQCTVALVDRNMDHSDYIIEFTTKNGTLEKTASDAGVFEQDDDGKWITDAGPGMDHPAESFRGNGWTGIRATLDCGVDDPAGGFHAAGGTCYWAAISNGRRGIVIDTEGLIGIDEATIHSVATLQFTR